MPFYQCVSLQNCNLLLTSCMWSHIPSWHHFKLVMMQTHLQMLDEAWMLDLWAFCSECSHLLWICSYLDIMRFLFRSPPMASVIKLHRVRESLGSVFFGLNNNVKCSSMVVKASGQKLTDINSDRLLLFIVHLAYVSRHSLMLFYGDPTKWPGSHIIITPLAYAHSAL